jgi:RNA polymerase sigma-70 factor (ECF subfamily)
VSPQSATSSAPTRFADADARAHEGFLYGVCYRMTGTHADAQEVVQETFLRALERPPLDTTQPWRPWLTRVAVNLCKDRLRRRKTRGYVGPWLPAPVELEASNDCELPSAARYERLESASFAFLLALEHLTPQQRAVLVLRDVLDYSVDETAAALGITVSNVKVTLHRARHALNAAESESGSFRTRRLSDAGREAQRDMLQRFMLALAMGDEDAMRACLADDVRLHTDGGGEFFAAKKPVEGRDKVMTFLLRVVRGVLPQRFEIRDLNGAPALVSEFGPRADRYAERVVTRIELSPDGLIAGYDSVLATDKVRHLFSPAT